VSRRDALLDFHGVSRTVLEARIRVLVRLLDEILDHPDVRDALYTDIQDLIDRAVESLIVRERG